MESFLQSIKNQAVGALNLAIGPQMSHQNIFDFNGAAFTEILELMHVEIDLKSVMMVLGKPKRYKMSWMKVTTQSVVSVAIGLYLIHLVNLSMATNTCVKPPGAVVKGPIMFGPQHANGHEGGMVMRL
jgi:hypothetical protein